MKCSRYIRSICSKLISHMMIWAIVSSSLFVLPLISHADESDPPGFLENINRANLKPEDRDLLLKQKYWFKELMKEAPQEEINACIKMLKNPSRMKFACMAPMGTTWAKYIRDVPKIYRQRYGSVVQFDAYIGLSLGNDPDYVRKMAAGSLESAGMTSWGMKYISKEMGIYELPFLFESYGEADYVIQKSWPYFVDKFKEKGFTLVPVNFEIGFLQVFSTNMVAKLPENLNHTKYGSWMGKVEIETLKRLNVNPVVITVTEVPSSLATGIIQTGSAPTMYMIGAQLMSFIEKEGGCSGINMFYPPGGLVYVRKNIFKTALSGFNEKEKKLLEKYIEKAMEKFDALLAEQAPKLAVEMREGNKKLLAHLQSQGMKLYIPTKEEREKWKHATRPVWDDLAGKVYPRELLDMILKYKAEYRKAHPEEFETYQWEP